jgi:hypothetical protein
VGTRHDMPTTPLVRVDLDRPACVYSSLRTYVQLAAVATKSDRRAAAVCKLKQIINHSLQLAPSCRPAHVLLLLLPSANNNQWIDVETPAGAACRSFRGSGSIGQQHDLLYAVSTVVSVRSVACMIIPRSDPRLDVSPFTCFIGTHACTS